MNSLRTIEKRCFEDLFGMQRGYVMNFSDNSFAEFFRKAANIDIYGKKYAFNGDSKAKKLRAFWEVESDILVGKILSELLEIWEYESTAENNFNPIYTKSQAIVRRLLSANQSHYSKPENTPDDFLAKEIAIPDLKKLGLDPVVTKIMEQRLEEVVRGMKSKASLSVIFLCGSILEGAMLGIATQKPEVFNRSKSGAKLAYSNPM